MGLLGTTTAEHYYTSSQKFITSANQADSGHADYGKYTLTVETKPDSENDFIVFVNGSEVDRNSYTYTSDAHVLFTSNHPTINSTVLVSFTDRSLGDYRYVSIQDMVNNFMIAYVGDGKLIDRASRSDVLFHAKRGIQEFSYDVSRIEKIQEVDIPPTLTIPMPQDYVNYVMLSWLDTAGIEHPIFPARITSRPSESIAQDDQGNYLFTTQGDTSTVTPSVAQTNFESFSTDVFSGNLEGDDYFLHTHYIANSLFNKSGRFGIDPALANFNGVFVVDEANGQFGFSSGLSGKTITIKYVSDGLATDGEMKVHKMLEDALYKHVIHAILSSKLNIPEYIVNRSQKDRRAAIRNAKIRLSNMKTAEMTNVMRGKSKIIKK